MRIFKKSIAVLLAILMLAAVMAVSVSAADEAPAAGYFVAGTASLCTAEWDPAAAENAMTPDADGLVYTKVYTAVPEGEGYEFKITAGSWDESYGKGDANFKFNVTKACDVTITFNSDTKEVKFTGDGVEVPVEKIDPGYYITGSEGLCGSEWKNSADPNTMMTQQDDGTYVKVFENIKAGEYNFKAIYVNAAGSVEWHPGGMGNDSKVTVPEDGATVTVVLKPTGNPDNDEAIAGVNEVPTYPAPTEPPTTEPETEPSTPAPATDGNLKVDVTSNFADTVSSTYDIAANKTLTVSFSVTTADPLVNSQGELSYDSTKLKIESFEMPNVKNSAVNTELKNMVKFNHTNESGDNFTKSTVLAKAVFTIIGNGSTTVDVKLEELTAEGKDGDIPLVTDFKAADGIKASAALSAPQKNEPSEVKLSAKTKTLKAGKTYTVSVKGAKGTPTFTSDKKTVAKVSKKGVVTALKKGTANIKVKVDGQTLKCKIKVSNNPTIKVAGKKFNSKKTYSVKKNGTLTVKLAGKAKSIKNTYKTSKKAVAKVASKKTATTVKIKGVKAGSAKITIKVNKVKSFVIKVKVKK